MPQFCVCKESAHQRFPLLHTTIHLLQWDIVKSINSHSQKGVKTEKSIFADILPQHRDIVSWLTCLSLPAATKWALRTWLTCTWSVMSWRGTWCPWFCPTPSTALREARRLFTSTTYRKSNSKSSPASYWANLSLLWMWALWVFLYIFIFFFNSNW